MLTLSGAWNVRDVGGVTTTDGAVVRSGRLLRSGQLSWLDIAAQQALLELGVTDVVDLRSTHELERYGVDNVPDGITVHHLPFHEAQDDDGESPHEHAYQQSIVETVDPEELPAAEIRFMAEQYREFARMAGAQRAVRQLFSLLADGRTVLTHCFAGKDRTGFSVAVVLKTLGVEDSAVLADYLLSNDAVPSLRQLMLERLDGRDDLDAEAREMARTRLSDNVLGVRPEYLDAAWEVVEAEHGSLDAYLRDAGVTAADVDRLRAELLG